MSVKRSIAAFRVPSRSGERRKYHGVTSFPPFLFRKGIRHSGCRSHSQVRFMEGARIHTRTPDWRNLWATIDQMSARTGIWCLLYKAALMVSRKLLHLEVFQNTFLAPMRPTF